MVGSDEGVPVVKHENETRQEEFPAGAHSPNSICEANAVSIDKGQAGLQDIASYEKNLVRNKQSA